VRGRLVIDDRMRPGGCIRLLLLLAMTAGM
jgi:hypothetical protein